MISSGELFPRELGQQHLSRLNVAKKESRRKTTAGPNVSGLQLPSKQICPLFQRSVETKDERRTDYKIESFADQKRIEGLNGNQQTRISRLSKFV